jgi:hypothetical protein
MNERIQPLIRNQKLRIAIGIATAMMIAGTSYLVAWNGYRNWIYQYSPEAQTVRYLNLIKNDIEVYRQAKGRLPSDLAELPVCKVHKVSINDKGQPRDVWGTPILYRVEGDQYTLLSYGRDGEPGGTGYDADLTPEDWPPKATLWEFTVAGDSAGMKLCCIGAGLLALPLCFRMSSWQPKSSLAFLVELSVTAVFAVAIAVVMSVLHVPTGH